MTENTTLIGCNLKTIRESYGETQLDLSQMLGYDSTATISMLEGGSRGQNRYDSLSAIAKHYRIPESLLFYPDLPKLPNYTTLPIGDVEKCEKLFASVFPIVFSKYAMENSVFTRIYKKQLISEKEILETLCFPKETFHKCLSQYDSLLKNDDLPEAAANSLWWILLYGLFTCYPKILEGIKKLRRNAISTQEFFHNWYLPDCSGESIHQEGIAIQAYLNEFKERIQDLIRTLYKNPQGIQTAEYYTALFYWFGLSGSMLRSGDSRLVGWAMLSALSEMGNPCALTCLSALEAFHKS